MPRVYYYLLRRVRFIDETEAISVSVSAPLFTYPDFRLPTMPPPSDIISPAVECAVGDVDF